MPNVVFEIGSLHQTRNIVVSDAFLKKPSPGGGVAAFRSGASPKHKSQQGTYASSMRAPTKTVPAGSAWTQEALSSQTALFESASVSTVLSRLFAAVLNVSRRLKARVGELRRRESLPARTEGLPENGGGLG